MCFRANYQSYMIAEEVWQHDYFFLTVFIRTLLFPTITPYILGKRIDSMHL